MQKVLEIHEGKWQDKKMKAPTDIASNQGSLNLVMVWCRPDVGQVYHRLIPSENPPSTASQCFPQFDCKTDCFDGAGDVRGACAISNWHVANGIASTLKAVCGTQTKQGGCLYEQPVVKRMCNGHSTANHRLTRWNTGQV